MYLSNFRAVKSILERKGYRFVDEVWNSDMCGIPHRRHRLWMGGILDSPHPESWIRSKVLSGLYSILQNAGPAMKNTYTLDSFLLCETEADVRAWMPRTRRSGNVAGNMKKWADLHKTFWVKIDEKAREHAVDAVKGNLLLAQQSERKQDLLGWL